MYRFRPGKGNDNVYASRIGGIVDNYFGIQKEMWRDRDQPFTGKFFSAVFLVVSPLLIPLEYLVSFEDMEKIPASEASNSHQ